MICILIWGFFVIPVAAQDISPNIPQYDHPFAQRWFIASMNPGETQTFTARVENPEDTDMTLSVVVKDSTVTPDGVFTYIPTLQENTEAGSWITLDANLLSLAAQTSQTVNFRVTVPPDTQPGEYAAVVAVQEQTSEGSAAVAIQQRFGARVYITVPGDISANVSVPASNPVLPGQDGYDTFIQTRFQRPYDFAHIRMVIQNSGAIFTTISGEVQLQAPNNNQYAYQLNRTASPREEAAEFAFDFRAEDGLPVRWVPGEYTLSYQLQSSPLIDFNKEEVAPVVVKESYTFIVTQDMLNTMQQDFETNQIQQEQGIQAAQEAGVELITTSTESEESSQEISMWWYVAIGIGMLIVGIVAGVTILIGRQRSK